MSDFEKLKARAKRTGNYHLLRGIRDYEAEERLKEAKRQARSREKECEEKAGCEA